MYPFVARITFLAVMAPRGVRICQVEALSSSSSLLRTSESAGVWVWRFRWPEARDGSVRRVSRTCATNLYGHMRAAVCVTIAATAVGSRRLASSVVEVTKRSCDARAGDLLARVSSEELAARASVRE